MKYATSYRCRLSYTPVRHRDRDKRPYRSFLFVITHHRTFRIKISEIPFIIVPDRLQFCRLTDTVDFLVHAADGRPSDFFAFPIHRRCFPIIGREGYHLIIFIERENPFRSGTVCPDCSPWINPGGSKGCWDVTDCTGDISKKVEISFFYFRSIPKSP